MDTFASATNELARTISNVVIPNILFSKLGTPAFLYTSDTIGTVEFT